MNTRERFYFILDGARGNDPNTDGLWSDGSVILCDSKELCDTIVTILEKTDEGSGGVRVLSGYYDSIEDERDDAVDKYSGWWYVGIEKERLNHD